MSNNPESKKIWGYVTVICPSDCGDVPVRMRIDGKRNLSALWHRILWTGKCAWIPDICLTHRHDHWYRIYCLFSQEKTL